MRRNRARVDASLCAPLEIIEDPKPARRGTGGKREIDNHGQIARCLATPLVEDLSAPWMLDFGQQWRVTARRFDERYKPSVSVSGIRKRSLDSYVKTG